MNDLTAPNLILPRGGRPVDRVDLISHDMDDGGWTDTPEVSDEFEPAFWVILQTNDISFDPTLSKEQAAKTVDLGVLTAHFRPWEIHLNWSTGWAQKIPPHHMAVLWQGIEQAIISPYLIVRTCWKCRRGSPRGPDGSWDEERMWIRPTPEQLLQAPDLPQRLPAVMPAYPCPGGQQWYPLLRQYRQVRCGEYDWFGRNARREQFQFDAALAAGKIVRAEEGLPDEDRLVNDMLIKHHPNTDRPMSRVRVTV